MLAALALVLAIFEAPLSVAVVAGGAVSIPIIIHLLNRRRFKVVHWAAMRFLLAAQRKNSRRMRLEQLLLLLVRCLVVLLLILAMASVTPWAEAMWRWFMPNAAVAIQSSSARTHKVLVLDGSFSMGVRQGEKTAFDRAKALAVQTIKDSPRGDAFSVVLLSAPPRRVVPEPSEDPQKVVGQVEALRLPHGNSDLAATLTTIESLLQSSPGKFHEKEVYFFTDLRKSTWATSEAITLSASFKRARSILVDAGGAETTNVAITGLQLDDSIQDVATVGRKCTLRANLHNYAQETKEVALRVYKGRARTAQGEPPCELSDKDFQEEQPIKVEPGRDQTRSFSVAFDKPGDWVVQVRIHAENDGLPLDDVCSIVLTVKKDLPVLLVSGKSFGQPLDQSAEWVRLALNPFDNPAEGSVVRAKVISTASFTDETSGDLSGYDCVFLCDVPSLSLAEARRLEGHLRRGGGVVFCMGSQVQVGEYNRLLYNEDRKLLPAPLVGVQSSGNFYQYQLKIPGDSDTRPPIRAFRSDSDRQTLLAPRFSKFIQTGTPTAGMKPRLVLSFVPAPIPGKDTGAGNARVAPESGHAILEWNPPALPDRLAKREPDAMPLPARMRGKAVLLTTTVNSDWSNWPALPSFPALMPELLYFASSGRLQAQSIEVGQPLELYLPKARGEEVTLRTPDGREERGRTQNLDDGSLFRWGDNDVSGLYRISLGDSPREYLFAVNVPAQTPSGQGSESDLTRTDREELQKSYPEWEFQTVKELSQIVRVPRSDDTTQELIYQPLGTGVAHWLLLIVLGLIFAEVLLAWVFGHYTATAATDEALTPKPITWPIRILSAMPWLLLVFGLMVAGVLIHDAITGDFLGFLWEGGRRTLERWAGIPAPAEGEGSHWRLEKAAGYLLDAASDPWLAVGVFLGGAGLVWWVYRQEGQKPTLFQRGVLMALRLGVLALMLTVLLPQLKLHFERQGWPDVVLLIDDSQSMTGTERYSDTDVRDAADTLAKEASRLAKDKRALATEKEKLSQQKEEAGQKRTPDDPERSRLLQEARNLLEEARLLEQEAEGLDKASSGADLQRLHLLQALATRNDLRWLTNLVQERKVKVHVYHCSTRAAKLAQATAADEVGKAADAVLGLVASPRNDSSQLGAAVRQVINEFRGSSLAAVVMLTDGVTTDGEDLVKASKYAAQQNVPLYFVGVGDAHEVRDVYLHDLQAADSVYVNDKMVFAVKLTAQGYKNVTLPVVLREKGKAKELDRKLVQVEPGKPSEVILEHQPKEPGEKTFIIDVPVQEDEVEKDNNKLEKQVSVLENKLIKVLYVEGYRRYEFHFLKTLLERENNRVKGNKTIDVKTLLLDADPGYVRSDRTALSEFPTRKELDAFDVVILGDVDPDKEKMKQHLKDLAGFVEDRGGGLLMIAGEKFLPHTYKLSPLKNVMPIDLVGDREDRDKELTEGYRLEMTPVGRLHPIFRPVTSEKENEEIWGRLREMYWYAEGYVPKRAAEVLAVHPTQKRLDRKPEKEEDKGTGADNHPLVIQQFVGSGRCMFFGFSESWRWGFREDQKFYNAFWIQTIRYLARSRLGRIDLKLDRQTPYRRGEPIKVTVRFPDDSPPPPDETKVKVVLERKLPGKGGEREVRTLNLDRMEGSRTAYETVVTQTPEGEYLFWLSVPALPDPKPKAECKVTAPPGEMYGLRMNQSDMETAATETRGKFYTLATADNLLKDLQIGYRVTVSTSGPPWVMWNHAVFFLAALLLFTTEWLMRKRLNLL